MSVNRNHWSAKEIEILLHYGADVAATKLGRSLTACQKKESVLGKNTIPKKKNRNVYEFEDRVRFLTNSPEYLMSYYKINYANVLTLRNKYKRLLETLKPSSMYTKYMKAIEKAGGIWVYGKQHSVDRDITTARYQRLKDKLTFVHEDRVSTAEELPITNVGIQLTEGYMPVEIIDNTYTDTNDVNQRVLSAVEEEYQINNPDRVPSPNKPEPALSFLERIWNKVSNW